MQQWSATDPRNQAREAHTRELAVNKIQQQKSLHHRLIRWENPPSTKSVDGALPKPINDTRSQNLLCVNTADWFSGHGVSPLKWTMHTCQENQKPKPVATD